MLVIRRERIAENFDLEVVSDVVSSMEKHRKQLNKISVSKDSFKTVRLAIKDVYKVGRTLYKEAYHTYEVEAFHDWRKFAKHLWYQVTMLQRMWPAQMNALASALDDLSSKLGDLHDTDIFLETLDSEKHFHKDSHYELCRKLMLQRRQFLVQYCRPLGARIFLESPKEFIQRLNGYFEVWKKGDLRLERYLSREDKFSSRQIGAVGTREFKVFSFLFGKFPVSFLHDVPLWFSKEGGVLYMVVDNPKDERPLASLSLTLRLNPLVSSECVPSVLHISPFNSGFLPRTLLSSKQNKVLEPIQLLEIGEAPLLRGSVVRVKMVGAICLESQGTLLHKVVVINVEDPRAQNIDVISFFEFFVLYFRFHNPNQGAQGGRDTRANIT